MSDVFDALFYDNINTGVKHSDIDYYYKDPSRIPAEILLKELVDIIKRNLY